MKLNVKGIALLAISLCALVLLAPSLVAQTFSASIAGVVTDPSGSVVAGARVHLRNMGTNDVRDATTTAAGTYKFDNLLPGTYEIRAEAQGFKTYVQSNMILRANTAATVNVALAVGGTEQNVEVTGEAVLVDTESANNSVTMDSHLIESLPNSYRNPLNFVFALAGTTEAQSGMTSRSTSFDQMGSMFGLNGGRIGNEQILIDGAPSTAVDWGGLFVAPNQDAVQEQQVAQNVYDAQYERSGAGVVTLITKSGTNSFHGSVYDYFRNSALDANSWGNDHSVPLTPKGLFHRNQFGATFGGPVSRSHRVFFFLDYEGLRQPDVESSSFLTVPTAKMHNGDFSELLDPSCAAMCGQIYNPFSTRQVTDASGTHYTRDPFQCDASGNPLPVNPGGTQGAGVPCNKIPSTLFDPVGQKIAALYPLPTQGGIINNFYKQGRGTTDNDKFDWRVDWVQSDKNRIFARMSDRVRQNYTPACFFCNGADNNATNNDRGFQVVVNDTYTPSPTWVIDSYVAVGHWHEEQTGLGLGTDMSKIGLSPTLSQAPLLPLVNADNYQTLGSTYSSYDFYVRSHGTAIENITKELSNHTIKFGGNYDISFMNNRQDVPVTFNFPRGFTACDPNSVGGSCIAPSEGVGSDQTGNAIAALLLGTGNGTSAIQMDPAMSLHTFGLYLQDQWRATPRLTVTVGLRYENQRPATERYNRLTYFDTNAVNPISSALGSTIHGAFEYANKDHRYAWDPDNKNFAPRLGVAYKITDKLVGRVGAGIFYSPASAMISFDQPGEFVGFTSTTNWIGSVNSLGYIPSNLVSNPFPNGLVQPVGSANGAMTLVGDGASQIWPKGSHPIGYTEQWSADLQYQLGSHAVAEIGYTGSRGHRLMYGNPNLNADQLPTQDLALGNTYLQNQVANPFYGIITDPNSPLSAAQVQQSQLLVPFPEYTYLIWNRSLPGAQSAYDALNVKFNKQFSNGLSLVSTYVWSKALDDGSEDFIGWTIGNMWRDSYHPKLDYAVSTHDQPHSFATALVYDLPYGRGKRFGNDVPKVVNGILGNWQVSSVIRLASGLPLLAPFYANNPLGEYGFPGQGVPDLVGDPRPAHQNLNNWINANAFQDPNANSQVTGFYRYGDAPARMGNLREAATKNLDFAVAKGFNFSERVQGQFRAEFLNAFNHPQYGGEFFGGWGSNIGLCIDCGDLGQVFGTRNDPRNIQMSFKLMF